jgi:hypothetical protein
MLAQGRENAKQALREHPETFNQVSDAVRDGLARSTAARPGPPRWRNVPQQRDAVVTGPS